MRIRIPAALIGAFAMGTYSLCGGANESAMTIAAVAIVALIGRGR